MRSLSIAMVAACPFPANHGSPASIREMSQALSSRGHTVHIVTYPIGQDIPVEGVTIHRTRAAFGKKKVAVGPTWYKPYLDILLVVKLCKVIRQEKIDIIHAHNYEGALAGFIAKIITGKPMLYNAVNTMADELPSYNFIRPKALAVILARFLDTIVPKMGDYITVVSEELHQFMLEKKISPDMLAIVPAGVNPGMFEGKDPDMMRRRYRIGERPLIIYTGTLDRFQRIDLLLKAMRVVLDSVRNAVLLIVGNIISSADLNQHKQLAGEIGIAENVIFTDEGRLEDIPFFLASADIAVIPRPSCPGFPVKLLNYMAAEKAIVTFEGSAKGLTHMKNALIVKNEDWQGFGQSVVCLLQDRGLMQSLGREARRTVSDAFDWRILAGKIEDIYRKILKEKGIYDNET